MLAGKGEMLDQIVTTEAAAELQSEAVAMAAWVVMEKQPAYPGKVIARLTAGQPTAYLMVADTLAELRAALPSRLERSDRMPADPEEVVEIWFADTEDRSP